MSYRRDFGLEIFEGIQVIKADMANSKVLRTNRLKEPATPQKICSKHKLLQVAFAGLMGVSLVLLQTLMIKVTMSQWFLIFLG
jgi:hypothetical protein